MANTILPNFIVMNSTDVGGTVSYNNETDVLHGYVRCIALNVFNPFAKIAVEPSKVDSKRYVHLRFCHSNKYWETRGQSGEDRYIVARSNQPEEDISKLSCTLFELVCKDSIFSFIHCHSQGWVQISGDTAWDSLCLYVDASASNRRYGFFFMDHDALVKLPKYVTFKGNGMYLKGVWVDRRPYLQFSGDDFNDEYVAYEVHLNPDGNLRILSVSSGFFWRCSPNWIWADSGDTTDSNTNTLFWPVKLDDRTIALRNVGNNAFCKRLTAEGKESCLNAGINHITREAELIVEERVLERSFYNVKYRMEDKRISDETPYQAGEGTAENDTDTDGTLSVKVSYVDKRSHSFNWSLSLALGGKSTIEAGIPFIVDGKIEVSAVVTGACVWGKVTETSETAEATYTVKVPPRSKVRVRYLATKGKCSVPFSYTQRDKMSSDGSFVMSEHDDGISDSINYYNFHFKQGEFEAL